MAACRNWRVVANQAELLRKPEQSFATRLTALAQFGLEQVDGKGEMASGKSSPACAHMSATKCRFCPSSPCESHAKDTTSCASAVPRMPTPTRRTETAKDVRNN